jgi:cyclophilin family peptidyl-prolyl cis-trans isomerase
MTSYTGKNITTFMDINVNGEFFGKIYINLYRDVFPKGVDNFVGIIEGQTYKLTDIGTAPYNFTKQTRRTYEGCKFFSYSYNNFLISGDIYANNGSDAGTIYNDEPILPYVGANEKYIPKSLIGLVFLVPFNDPLTGKILYDSTFMISLDSSNTNNAYEQFGKELIIIGQIYKGYDVIQKINEAICPFAGKQYPVFSIGKCNVINK